MFYEFNGIISKTRMAYSDERKQTFKAIYDYEISGIIFSKEIENDIKILEDNIAYIYKMNECKLITNQTNIGKDIDRYIRITKENIEMIQTHSRNNSNLENFLNGLDIDIKKTFTKKQLIK